MELYVGQLSSQDTVEDLRQFFKAFARKAGFKIVKLIRPSGPVYIGVVSMESEKLAAKAIRKLHTRKLNGRRVTVREFIYRSGGNERRALNWRERVWNGIERRMAERRERARRANTAPREPAFTGYGDMAVKRI